MTTITDGFGNYWDSICPRCGEDSITIVRPGKVQCDSEKCYQLDQKEKEETIKEFKDLGLRPPEFSY